MLASSSRPIRGIVRKVLFTFTGVMLLAVAVAAECERRIIFDDTRDYGGRQYSDFYSCGGSAGNFAYTCPETEPGESSPCYYNEVKSADADEVCGCSSGGIALEESQK